MNKAVIRILWIETNPIASRSVKLYLQGIAGRQMDIRGVKTHEDLEKAAQEHWDVMIYDGSGDLNGKAEMLKASETLLRGVPRVNLTSSSDGLMTTCAETTLDDFFNRISVNPAAVLRSVSNLLERRRLEQELDQQDKELTKSSHVDEVTGLWSESYMLDRIIQEFRNCKRYRTSMTCCLFDVVGFDTLVDNYGDEVGAQVLCTVSDLLRTACRNTDYLGRWGKHAFSVVLTNTNLEGSLIALERTQRLINNKLFSGKNTSNFTIEACFGILELNEDQTSVEQYVQSLDQSLTKALASGPGQVQVADKL